MSDLFISELLVLALLLPVLLRPFFRRLQRIEGLSILPFLAFLMCLAIGVGIGLKIAFLPVFIFTGIVFVSGLPRFFRLLFRLPTDWYSPLSVIYSGFLLLLFIGVLGFSLLFAPEKAYQGKILVQRKVFMQKVSPGVQGFYTIVAPSPLSEKTEDRPVVIILGDITSGNRGRDTTAWILAENGYTVIEADFTSNHDYTNPLLFWPSMRSFFSLSARILQKPFYFAEENEIDLVATKEISRLVQYVHTQYGASVPLFVVSEGSSNKALLARMTNDPFLFSGVVCIVPETKASLLPPVSGGSVSVSIASYRMPSNAGSVPLLILTGETSYLPGYGELAADDVLATVLCNGKRDSDRKMAELTARRVLTWLDMRKNNDNK